MTRAELDALAARIRSGDLTPADLDANSDLDELELEYLSGLLMRTRELDELDRISTRSGLSRDELRHLQPGLLANRLQPDDFNFVMQSRPTKPPPPTAKPTREEITARVLERYDSGETVRAIAKALGLSRALVAFIIDSAGSPPA